MLVRIAAAQAARDEGALRTAFARVAGAAEAAEVEEVLLQSYLFLGFPAAIWGLGIWRSGEAGRSPAASEPASEPSEGSERADRWRRSGEALCSVVYGENYEKLRRNVRALHPALDRWMVTEGYGKVLSRSQLDPLTRELCTVAALAVTGWEAQLHSHLRGALNLGAERAEAEDALETGLALSRDEEWRGRARELWARVVERHVR